VQLIGRLAAKGIRVLPAIWGNPNWVSGYTARPPEARQKPKVSAFISAKFDKILALEPDLVLGFSNLQADIARELISRGVNVMVFNQRSVDEILDMILMLGRKVGAGERADALAVQLRAGLDAIAAESTGQPRPRVFFEEWHDPLISGIRWVEELVEIAGGTPIFPALRDAGLARDRIVTADAVRDAAPELIVGSWCGRRVNKKTIATTINGNARLPSKGPVNSPAACPTV